jgi:urease accessory protein
MSLARLLQLASPTLPVGAYSYSGGLEAALEAGVVQDAASAERWIGDVLELSVARMEAPVFLALFSKFSVREGEAEGEIQDLNEQFLASRETAELRAETVQMGYSLARLLKDLGEGEVPLAEPSFPAAFAWAAARWKIEPGTALEAYLWAWLENQVMAAVKAVPLGQTDGQRMLLRLGASLEVLTENIKKTEEEEFGNFAPGLAMASARHETQYSRLFRS